MNTLAIFQMAAILIVLASGTSTVLIRDPRRQVFMAGLFGLAQVLLFFSLQAPDVALSELVIGTVGLPLLLLFTLGRLKSQSQDNKDQQPHEERSS